MELTAEELAIYGIIDAETYIQLSNALMTGLTSIRETFPGLDRRASELIRTRAAEVFKQRCAETSLD
jgi:hypothetical protein